MLLADENPAWVAARIQRFLDEEQDPPPSVDLSYLTNKVTLNVGYFGTLGNAALASS
jgi:hypothetical protein